MGKYFVEIIATVSYFGSLLSCDGQNRRLEQLNTKLILDTVVKDIPLTYKGQLADYYYDKLKVEKKLQIDSSIHNGFDSLQIRLWYGYARTDSGQIVIIKNT